MTDLHAGFPVSLGDTRKNLAHQDPQNLTVNSFESCYMNKSIQFPVASDTNHSSFNEIVKII